MQFAFTDEQQMIRDTARSFVDTHGEQGRVRAAFESDAGFDRESWRVLTGELGFGGIAIPEAYGGAGLGHVELASVQEILGRALLPSPYLASIGLAATALLAGGTEDQKQALLPGIASGEVIATLAYCGEKGGVTAGDIDMKLSADGTLNGTASFVQFGHVADLIVFAAHNAAGGISLAALPADTAGIKIEPLTMMDLTRPMSRVRCTNVAVPADRLIADAAGALDHAMKIGAVLIAADATGGCEAILEITTAYAKERVQFGRAIGSFQAIKHRLADMMVAAEAAKSTAWYAACTADEAPEMLDEAASVAKAGCTEAMTKCAGDMIQLHGGIGFTWEHVAHLYFKRARSNATVLGTQVWHRERIMQQIEKGVIG